MANFFDAVSDFFKGKFSVTVYLFRIEITEWIFRLHYVWTSWLLMIFVFLLCWTEWVGGHIKCLPIQEDTSNDPVIPTKVLNTYCYVSSTFTIPFDPRTNALAAGGLTKVTHSMLGGPQYIPGKTDQQKQIHGYYQWVAYFLFLQAIMFQATIHVWTYYENSKIAHLVQDLKKRDLQMENEAASLKRIAKYLMGSRGEHFWWSMTYILCEFGNLVIVLFNIYFTDFLLGGEFSKYGFEVFQFLQQDPEDRLDPMSRVFPRMTKCLFHTFGPSGSIQRFDTLCILALNILNEKIFTVLWFWFIVVAILTSAQLVYRLATLVSARVRLTGLQIETYPKDSQVVVVLDRLKYTDWILLRLLRLNLSTARFQKLIGKMYDEILEM